MEWSTFPKVLVKALYQSLLKYFRVDCIKKQQLFCREACCSWRAVMEDLIDLLQIISVNHSEMCYGFFFFPLKVVLKRFPLALLSGS